MDEQMKVSFVGDASSLEAASRQSTAALDNVTKSTSKVSASLQQASAAMARNAAVMGGGIKKGSNEATQSLINLSRVAQDAPYGFIGIANNLNPLLESFQRLKGATGTAGGALKALGSELLGAGGVGLALGVVSSLLVVFGDKLFSSGSAAKSQADKLKEAKQALDDYVESLNDIDKANLKGKQSAQEQLVSLQTLYTATQNANIPLADRKKLVDELQDQYPKYFANVSDEIILAGGAAKAYNQLSAAIIASAKARAAQDAIVDIQKELLTVDQQLAKNTVDRLKTQQQITKLNQAPKTERLGGRDIISDEAAKAALKQGDLNKLVEEGNKILAQRNELNTRANQLANVAQSIVQQNPEALLKTGTKLPKDETPKKVKDNTKELEDALNERKRILTEFQKDFEILKLPVPDLSMPLEKFSIEGLTNELRDKLNKALLQQPLKLTVPTEVQGIDPKKVPIPLNPTITWEPTDFQKKLEDFNKQLTDLVSQTQFNLGVSIGEGIAASFNGDGLDSAFKNIASIMGDFVQALGKLLIKESIQIAAFKKAFAALIANPIAGIAVGIGLVALGGIIKNTVLPKPKGFAAGGFVPGVGNGDTVPAMLTPGEYVIPKNKVADFFNRGAQYATGNVQQVPYIAGFDISHDKVRLMLKRAEAHGNIFGR